MSDCLIKYNFHLFSVINRPFKWGLHRYRVTPKFVIISNLLEGNHKLELGTREMADGQTGNCAKIYCWMRKGTGLGHLLCDLLFGSEEFAMNQVKWGKLFANAFKPRGNSTGAAGTT